MSYKIVENFLPEEQFATLQSSIVENGYFPWFADVGGVAYLGDTSDKYFKHTFYDNHQPSSPHFHVITPVLNMLDAKALIRARANCYTRNSELIEHKPHVDYYFKHKAFILYLNNNNGFTRMSDGKIIESVANRALFFDGGAPHNSTNCTDALVRVNISINYL